MIKSGERAYNPKDIYAFGTQEVFETIWDTSGNNVLSAEGQSSNVEVDLRQGEYSSIGFDSLFAELRLWRDGDQDGISDAGELVTLSELGITSLSLTTERVQQAVADNLITARASYTRSDGSLGEVADVWFRIEAERTLERGAEDLVISEAIQALPWLKGSGVVSDLDVAMARDPLLKEMVEELTTLTLQQAAQLSTKVDAAIRL